MTTFMEQVPNNPNAYILTLSRPIDKYDNYSEIFDIKIIDDDHMYTGMDENIKEATFRVYFDKLTDNHTADTLNGTNLTKEEL